MWTSVFIQWPYIDSPWEYGQDATSDQTWKRVEVDGLNDVDSMINSQ
jgi:hypothetical protein